MGSDNEAPSLEVFKHSLEAACLAYFRGKYSLRTRGFRVRKLEFKSLPVAGPVTSGNL